MVLGFGNWYSCINWCQVIIEFTKMNKMPALLKKVKPFPSQLIAEILT